MQGFCLIIMLTFLPAIVIDIKIFKIITCFLPDFFKVFINIMIFLFADIVFNMAQVFGFR